MGGAIENDADLVVMLARHNCVGQNHMEVCIAANRNGVPGHGMVLDNFNLCRFETLTQDQCYAVAGGQMHMSEALLIDQGYWQHGRKAQEDT